MVGTDAYHFADVDSDFSELWMRLHRTDNLRHAPLLVDFLCVLLGRRKRGERLNRTGDERGTFVVDLQAHHHAGNHTSSDDFSRVRVGRGAADKDEWDR